MIGGSWPINTCVVYVSSLAPGPIMDRCYRSFVYCTVIQMLAFDCWFPEVTWYRIKV